MDSILYPIIMVGIFAGIMVAGYLLAAVQLKLVKEETWDWYDRLRAGIFGFFFSCGVSVIVGIGFIFATGDPTLNTTGEPQVTLPVFMAVILFIILGYLTIFPLLDFLNLAWSPEPQGLTPFQRFLERKFIDRFQKPQSYAVAASLYFFLFLFPPLLVGLLTGFQNFLNVWLSWELLVPLVILSYYGARGWLAGIFTTYFHIPDMSRSLFVGFDKPKRMMSDFFDDPVNRIVFPIMLFVYVWTYVSLFQTLGLMLGGEPLVNTAGAAASIFMVLLFGIVGYFSRFWGRKVKFRTIDILFAAYVIAAVGLNVMINFLVLNQDPLFGTFGTNSFTHALVSGASDPWDGSVKPRQSDAYLLLVPAAIIEEAVMLIVVTSHLVRYKSSTFLENTRASLITKCRQTFDPVPLFNFLKASDPNVRERAREALIEVYGRLPNKKEHDFTRGHFMNPLLDGICAYNPHVRQAAREAFLELEKAAPERVLPFLVEALESANADKKYQVTLTLMDCPRVILKHLQREYLISLLYEREWHMRHASLQVIQRILEETPEFVTRADIEPLLDDPDFAVQAEALVTLERLGARVPPQEVLSRLHHPNQAVRGAAALAFGTMDVESLDARSIPLLVKMMEDPNWKVRASVFRAIGNIGQFAKFPVEPLVQGLFDQNQEVQDAASFTITRMAEIEPFRIPTKRLLQRYKSGSSAVKKAMAPVLGNMLGNFEAEILPAFLESMTHPDKDVKRVAAAELVKYGKNHPRVVAEKLIGIPEEAGFVKKGIVSESLVKIGAQNPEEILPFVTKQLQSPEEQHRKVAATVTGELGGKFPDLVNVKTLAHVLLNDDVANVRKQVGKAIAEIASTDPGRVKSIIVNLFVALKDGNESVRITISKTINDIAKQMPEIVPIRPIIQNLDDEETFTREALVKILGNVGHRLPEESVKALIEAMNDDEWIVRKAAADALGNVAVQDPTNERIPKLLLGLLEDKDKWVRAKAATSLSLICAKNPEAVPLDKILPLLRDEEEKVKAAALKVLGALASTQFDKVVEPLTQALGDPSKSVKDSAITALTKVGEDVPIKQLLPHLLKLLSDDTPLPTQQGVALVLRRLVKYEREEIKKRVVSLLRIRCETSQDETICGVLQELTAA